MNPIDKRTYNKYHTKKAIGLNKMRRSIMHKQSKYADSVLNHTQALRSSYSAYFGNRFKIINYLLL